MLSFSFVVLSSPKLSYTFIIFLSLCRNFIFCDNLGLIFCFSHPLFTYFLENSFFPIYARKTYIFFSTFVIVCDLIEERFYFSDLIEQAHRFWQRLLGPIFRGCSCWAMICLFSCLPGLLLPLLPLLLILSLPILVIFPIYQ